MSSRRGRYAIAGGIAAIALAFGTWLVAVPDRLDPANPNVSLANIEAVVSRRYRVPEMTSTVLAGQLDKPETVVFDVREPDEFAQSHIAGAQRVDPSLSAADFFARYGGDLKGKAVVFYCAVGVRSAMMLSRVQEALPGYGATAGYNLRGGIFRWFAGGGAVQSAAGPMQSVHPYDSEWKQLLDRTVAVKSQVRAP